MFRIVFPCTLKFILLILYILCNRVGRYKKASTTNYGVCGPAKQKEVRVFRLFRDFRVENLEGA